MTQADIRKSFPFDRPGNYRIRVLGFLAENWSERLCGLRIKRCKLKHPEGPVTELVGKVRDQAELSGLLNSLYGLHLTLLSEKYFNSD